MAITSTDIKYRLSGGSSNTDPAASIGVSQGPMATQGPDAHQSRARHVAMVAVAAEPSHD